MKYPEHEKLNGIKDKSQFLGEFIEWAQSKGMTFCEYSEDGEGMYRVQKSINTLLAEFFEIDLNKIAEEKDAMLKELVNLQNKQ